LAVSGSYRLALFFSWGLARRARLDARRREGDGSSESEPERDPLPRLVRVDGDATAAEAGVAEVAGCRPGVIHDESMFLRPETMETERWTFGREKRSRAGVVFVLSLRTGVVWALTLPLPLIMGVPGVDALGCRL
jgi:hypothetical protein